MCFNGTIGLICLRFEIDLSRLPVKESQLYTHVLNPGKGRLVLLVTLTPCWGVSVSDIHTAPLDQPDEKDSIVEKFVSLLPYVFLLSVTNYRYNNHVFLACMQDFVRILRS